MYVCMYVCMYKNVNLRAEEDSVQVQVDDVSEVVGLHHHREHISGDARVVH